MALCALALPAHGGNNVRIVATVCPSLLISAPPPAGWTAVEQSNNTKAGLEPPPEVGKRFGE